MGISNFAVFSDGTFIESKDIWHLVKRSLPQRRARKTSSPTSHQNVEKLHKNVSHIYERLGNLRDNFAHQLSHRIVNDYGIICLEDIDIKNLIEKKPYMAKSVLDASWNRFRTYVTYKAESAGRKSGHG